MVLARFPRVFRKNDAFKGTPLGALWEFSLQSQLRMSLHFPATLVKFLFQVSPLVCNEVGAIAESFATVGAFVGLLSCVNSLVNDENRIPAEAFAALGTPIRLISQVGSLVHH